MIEDGLTGACYVGAVDGDGEAWSPKKKRSAPPPVGGPVVDGKVRVRYEELLTEDESEILVEEVDVGDVRLRPPPSPPGFIALVRPGDALELYYEDGWWEVDVVSVGVRSGCDDEGDAEGEAAAAEGGGKLRLTLKYLDKTHVVSEALVRPRWLWAPAARVWRYELHVGHGCVPLEGEGAPTFKFAGGVMRSSNGVI